MESVSKRLGLRGRLVGTVVALLVLSSLALAALLPARLDRLSRSWAESRSLGIARLVARACEAPLDFDDPREAATVLGELQTSRGAVYAALVREDGRTFASWGARPADAPGPAAVERVTFAGRLVHASVPIATRGGYSGTLLLGFDLAELEERRAESRRIVGQLALLLLALGIPSVFLIGSIFVQPVRRMTAVAQRIAAGDGAARAHLERRRTDEVGTLAAAFDTMLDRLAEKEEGIRALAATLERWVDERTAELAAANRELESRYRELARAQEQLVVADRRVSVGRLAAGVAHEINNPLAFVDGNLGFLGPALVELRSLLGPGAPAAALASLAEMAGAVADARQGTARVQHIVRGLKNFSRTAEEAEKPVSVRDAARGAADMAAHEIKHRARLVTDLGALPPVRGNEVRLSQVFLNLLVNAAQAMKPGPVGDNEVRITGRTDARGWAVIEVRDNGRGILPEVRSRLFEPFFTTKPVGEGTGLGLSISRGIVEACGGTIEVESEPGRGSTFRVSLPPAEPVPAPVEGPRPSAPAIRRRLPVVDDEPLVSRSMVRLLGRDHEVQVAERARAALALLEGGQHFDCILCDLMMPDMDGLQFREELRRRWPADASHLVFVTGGAVTAESQEALASGSTPWLEKPVDPDRLRRLLDALP